MASEATSKSLEWSWKEHDALVETTRESEFPNLKGVTYLDHTGATLYSQSQLKNAFGNLSDCLYGNPHSANSSSQNSTEAVERARDLILQHFSTSAEEYDVVFTSGTTGALKLLADVFPWSPATAVEKEKSQGTQELYDFTTDSKHPLQNGSMSGSNVFCYLQDNHTSVVGMREVAIRRGAAAVCVPPSFVTSELTATADSTSPEVRWNKHHPHEQIGLFAYPAMSNFSGTKYPLEWTNLCRGNKLFTTGPLSDNMRWLTVLDAAALVPTSHLDLACYKPDFVALSFYKMFGYPTGLGCLLVRRDVGKLLQMDYFGGGSVAAYSSNQLYRVPRPSLHERLEHGTLPFLDIVALQHGFTALTSVGGPMELIALHTFKLAQMVYNELESLRHYNGSPACQLYSVGEYKDPTKQGGIVNFNILDEKGNFVGYSQVGQMAAVYNIHLRTGCFCNTGACQSHLQLTSEDLRRNLQAGHVCGDSVDIVKGRPTGSVRVSFGYMSTQSDASELVKFIQDCFVVKSPPSRKGVQEVCESHKENSDPKKIHEIGDTVLNEDCDMLRVGDSLSVSPEGQGAAMEIEQIALYPVKSCKAFQVSSWPVSSTGLLYDREWAIVGENGATITQKHNAKLCAIHTFIDLEKKVLKLSFNDCDSVSVPLSSGCASDDVCSLRICGQKVQGVESTAASSQWLSRVLGCPCKLVRKAPHAPPSRVQDVTGSTDNRSFSNQAQYLLITRRSVEHLYSALQSNQPSENTKCCSTVRDLMDRFRANLVLSGTAQPFEEDNWKRMKVGAREFSVVGPCTRCRMICIDQGSGEREGEPLRTLFSLRGQKAHFGIYLSHARNLTQREVCTYS